jgi:uncharacterized RDD family membrane protein YckC
MTAEEISANYDTSIIVQRWIGAWVDFIVVLAIFLVPDLISNRFYQQLLPVWIIAAFAYYVVMESWTGRTLGKLVSGTVVVDRDGNFPGIGQSMLRTVFRLVEVNPLLMGGVPAGLAAAFSKGHQRIGDMAASTWVIKHDHLKYVGRHVAYVPEERLQSKKRAPLAIAAGYLGLCSVIVIPAPFALVVGILALRQLRAHPELGGKAGAIFGIVMGTLVTGLIIATLFVK